MRLFARRTCYQFAEVFPDSAPSLDHFIDVVEEVIWENPNQVRESFPNASFVGRFVVFNIHGGAYRLIADIHYNRGHVYVDQILPHREYDKGNWQRR